MYLTFQKAGAHYRRADGSFNAEGAGALKAAAKSYHAQLTPIKMPWAPDPDTADTFQRPPDGQKPRIPNIAHWAWRSGDADWTLALSVVMARVVQRFEVAYLHTGPLGDGDWSYTTPKTPAGREALWRAVVGALEGGMVQQQNVWDHFG